MKSNDGAWALCIGSAVGERNSSRTLMIYVNGVPWRNYILSPQLRMQKWVRTDIEYSLFKYRVSYRHLTFMIKTFEQLMKSCKNLTCYSCIFNVQLHVHLKKWTLKFKPLYLRNYASYFNKIRRISCVNTHIKSLKVWLKSILPWLKYSIFLGDCFLLAHPVYFNGRLSKTCFSEANGPIFTKISGLVDMCKGMFTVLSFFLFLKGRCHGKQLQSKYRHFSRTNLLCRAAIPKSIAISQFRLQKIKENEFLYILCTILVTFGPETPEFMLLTIAPFAAIRQKSTYHAKYLRMSWI